MPKRVPASFLAAAFLLLIGLGFSLASYQGAQADSPGGNPTKTPTRTPEPTATPTVTATFTQPPTLTPLPEVHLPLVVRPGGTAQATPKALPTGTLLSLDEISATLQASGSGAGQSRPAFWIYLFIIFVVAAAAVVAVLLTLMRQKNQPEVEDEQKEP